MKLGLFVRACAVAFGAIALVASLPVAAAAAPFAYVANRETDNVSEIDLDTMSVVRTLPAGNGPYGIAISPDRSKIYVSNFWAGTVSVVELAGGTVAATVGGMSKPTFHALNPSGTRLYVPHNAGSNLSVVDTSTNTALPGIGGVGSEPISIAAHPDGTRMYVGANSANTVAVVNIASNSVTKTITVGQNCGSIAVDPTGTNVYVTSLTDDRVDIISTATDTRIGSIPVGDRPWGLAITSDGGHMWVSNVLGKTVVKVNLATRTIVDSIAFDLNPCQVALNSAGTKLLVVFENDDIVKIIDTATHAETTVAVGDLPIGVAVEQIPVPPFAPNGLTATVIPSARVLLEWNDLSENERFFDVYRKVGSGSLQLRATLPPNTTSYSSAVLPNTTYTWVIRARNSAGSADSDPAVITTPALPPAPTDLTVESTVINKAEIDWTDNASDELSYEVERRWATGARTFTVPADTTHFVDTLTDRTRVFTYKVRAVNVMGGGPWSNTGDLPILPPPSAPSDLAFTLPFPDKVDLTWTDHADSESGFLVERSSTAGVSVFKLPANGTTFRDSVTIRSIEYSYRVRAYGISGNSGWSNTVTVPILPPPNAPSGLTATAAKISRVDLTWTDNSTTETRHFLYRKPDGGSYTLLVSLGANKVSFIDTSVPAGTWVYKVVASNRGGTSDSNEAVVEMPLPPAAPSGVNAEKIGSSVQVTWLDNSSTETHFVVERKINDGNWVTYRTVAANVLSIVDVGISAGNTYSYRVRALNVGGYSPYSDPGSIAIP